MASEDYRTYSREDVEEAVQLAHHLLRGDRGDDDYVATVLEALDEKRGEALGFTAEQLSGTRSARASLEDQVGRL